MENLINGYVGYKDSILSHYDSLLSNMSHISSKKLIEGVKKHEIEHKESIRNSSEFNMKNFDVSDFLTLTPTNELNILSSTFDKILTLRENMINMRIEELRKHVSEHTEPHFQKIQDIETGIHSQLQAQKDRMF